jgi:cellulose synthase operon protein C
VLSSPAPDANSLSLAGQAYLQEGDVARSEAMFAKATRQDPKNTLARTAQALNKLSKGNAETGFAELEAAAAGDAGHRADLALIAARLRNNDSQGALRAIDALEKKQPAQPLAHVLRGRVLLTKKDTAGATASFEQALKLDPLYYPAASSLAALDLSAGKPDLAQRRFEALLKADPTSYRAALGLAELKARVGGSKDEVAKLISDAARANPTEPAPRLALVKYLLQQQDAKRALAAAQEGHAALPANTDLLYQLGVAQLAAGQPQQAVSSFVKLASALPTRTQPELALADAHVATKDYDAARRSLERALKLDPGLSAAKLGMARLSLLQKRHDEAIKIARALHTATPKMAAAYVLEAETEIDRGNLAAAIAPLRTALPLASGSTVAILLHRTLAKLGRTDEAERLAASWRKDHPKDPAFAFYLGDMALSRNEYAAAEAHYRSVIEMQPDNALAHNNVAWLMTRQNKPGAVAVAQRANQLLPNRAPLMDTLAWALAHEDQVPKAIELQKKAIADAPDDHGLKLTLAKIYLKGGDRERARAELDDLTRLGPRFGRQVEVVELMKAVQ